MNKRPRVLSTLLLSGFSFGAVSAQTVETEGAEGTVEREDSTRSQVEFGLGVTRKHTGETGPSLGVSYHYRLNPSFSIGALGEYTFGDIKSAVIGVPLTLRFGHRGLNFVAMPGFEFEGSHSDPLLRLGMAYEFELEDNRFLKPELNAILVDDEVDYMVGVTIGFGF